MSRIAYLLAASHSGTTLLAMLLGAQPGACTTGELKASSLGGSNTYRCSCRERIRKCEFWQAISRSMEQRGIRNFDITNAETNIFDTSSRYVRRLLAPLYRGGLSETIRDVGLSLSSEWRRLESHCRNRNLALIESILEVSNAKVIVDSSKTALRLKYLLPIQELEIKVIRVIRDGRAVSLTYTDEWNYADSSVPELRGGGNGLRRPPPRRSIAEAANEWKRSNESIDALASSLPTSQWTEVRYEELCKDPTSTLKRLALFMDLEPNEVKLDFRNPCQHIIGNGMRMDATTEILLDERWRNALSKDDLDIFNKVAGNLNRSYGYL